MKKKTATEVQMEDEVKMRREYNEWLINDDKAFRSMVLAKLDSKDLIISVVIIQEGDYLDEKRGKRRTNRSSSKSN